MSVRAKTDIPDCSVGAPAGSTGAALLLRRSGDTSSVDALRRKSFRIAGGLQACLRARGFPQLVVAPGEPRMLLSDEWQQGLATDILWVVQSSLTPTPLQLALPQQLLLRLLDIFYGGDGRVGPKRAEPTASEQRFAARLGQEFGAALFAHDDPDPRGAHIEARLADHRAALDRDAESMLAVLDFVLAGTQLGDQIIRVACRADVVPLWTGAGESKSAPAAVDGPPPGQFALHQALGRVMLPVNSVLARPEITLAKMLKLQVGDVIPLALPQRVPVNVQGHLLASGTVGDADGRAAIQVDSIRRESK